MDSFKGLEEKIDALFSKKELEDDIGLFHETIWPAVVLCEEYFRKSKDVRALELEAQLLCQMGDNRFQGQYLQDAYVICRRILEIVPNKEEAKYTMNNHIIPFFKKDLSVWEGMSKENESTTEMLEYHKKNNESIELELDSYFIKCKNDKFELFLDGNVNNFSSN